MIINTLIKYIKGSRQDNYLALLIIKMADIFKIKISKSTIKQSLLTHPEYPNIKSITDAFQEWNISNIVVKVNVSDLLEIPYPSLAQVTSKDKLIAGNYFILLTNIIKDRLTYYEVGKGTITEAISDFSTRWQGVLVLIKFTDYTGEKNYKKNLVKDYLSDVKIVLKTLPIVAILTLLFIHNGSIAVLFIVNILGIILSVWLLKTEILHSITNNTSFCEISGKLSCSKVLNSKASKLFGLINMSEIGIIYFIFNTISLSISIAYKDILNGLLMVSSISLFYTFFSIYYQAIFLRSWCIICTAIQIILWSNFLILLKFNKNFLFIYDSYAYCFLFFTFSISMWLYLRESIINGYKYTPLFKNLIRIKSNQDVFISLSKNQNEIYDSDIPQDLIIGDKEASNYILLVSGLFCTSCSEAYQEIKQLLNHYPKKFKLIVCFCGDIDDSTDFSIIANSILSMKNEIFIEEALTDWYESSDKQRWFKKYKKHVNLNSISLLENHINFCKKYSVIVTPSVYLNGYLLPNDYSINDLKYLV